MILQAKVKKKLAAFTLEAQLQLNEGQALGLMGPSGSGKSMLLKILAGLEDPDSGYIALEGRALYDSEQKINLAPQKRCLGYLFQSYALFPNMTVAGNITCVLKAHNRYSSQELNKLLSRLQLQGLEGRYPKELSGGQQQRAAIARLLASRPKVVFLDEPFSALDTNLKEQLRQDLAALLKEEGMSCLLVSHDEADIKALCPRVLYIKEGRVYDK